MSDKKDSDDDKFFDVIYTEYYDQVYIKIKRMLYSEVDDDITSCVQDTFKIAWIKRGLLKNHENIGGWLIVTASRVANNFNKNYKIRQNLMNDSIEMEDIADETDFADDIVETVKFEEYLKSNMAEKFINQLSEIERLLYELKHKQKLSNEEIGEISGISANAVASRNKRLIQKFKKNHL